MTTAVQRRRGTNTEHASFTGLDGEITVNTTTYTLHIHDGATVGGVALAKADGSNLVTSSIDINGGTIDGTVIGGSSAAAITGTTITGTSFVSSGNMTFGDNDRAVFGAGGDLQIYHDTNSYIQDTGDGSLFLLTQGAEISLFGNTTAEYMGRFIQDGAVELYHNGSKKLATTATGIDVTGTVTADGLTVDGNAVIDGGATDNTVLTLDSGTPNTYLKITDSNSTNGTFIGATTNDLNFYPNNSLAVTMTAAGNVGIGTSSPSSLLQLLGSPVATSGALATFRNSDATSSNTSFGGVLFNSVPGTDYSIGKSNVNSVTTLSFRNANTGASYMDIDSSGNVGIGTSSPAAKLHVDDGTGAALFVGLSSNIYYRGLEHIWQSQNNTTERMRIDSSGNVGINATTIAANGLQIGNTSSTDTEQLYLYSNKATFSLEVDGANNAAGTVMTYSWANGGQGSLRFKNASGEVARLDASGNLLIGYTSSNGAYKLQVNSQIFATSATIATSDGRYKENVEPLSGALDLVAQLNPVQFDWKEHPVHNFDRDSSTVGFIAQEVQSVLADKPYLNSIVKRNECVIEPEETDDDGNVIKDAVTEEFFGIAEGNMVALLTKAIQELKAEFDAYKEAHP